MGVRIDDLRQKLRLLETYGPFGPMEAIAEKLGKRPKTVWGWADGSPGAAANSVPRRSLQGLLSLFEEALAGEASPEQVHELVFGPTAWLENRLRKSQSTSLFELIDSEADMKRLVLYREDTRARELVESNLDQETNADAPQVQLNEWFRLAVERDLRGFDVLALQNANAQWGILPWQAQHQTGHILIPGSHPNGEQALIRERNMAGRSLFLIMATKAPIPSMFKDVGKNRVTFDATLLGALSDFYSRQSDKERRLFALWVQIGEFENLMD